MSTLKGLQIKLKKFKTAERIAEKKLKENKKYQVIQTRLKKIDKRQSEIRREQEKLEIKANTRITGDGSYPYYSRGGTYSYGTSTNINGSVLLAIGKIVPLSHLKASQIEGIAKKFIDKEQQKYPQIQKLGKEYESLGDEENKLWKQKHKLEEELDEIRSNRASIQRDIESLKEEEEHPEKIKKRVVIEQSRETVFDRIDDIYKEFEKIEKNQKGC